MSSFIDHAQIEIKAGKGGPGCVSFRREKYVPRGGPDGGNGGNGGSVFLVGDRNFRTLLDYRYQNIFQAPNGSPGQSRNKNGRRGTDLFIPVPLGTLILDAETGTQLADLVEDRQEVCLARGGVGGKGNAFFASATRQSPKFAQPGMPGETRKLILELKLLADIGLVGFPNAGKSTLISAISAARPKIADYPFTTLVPHLGVVHRGVDRSFVVADIPGIIEESHAGKGLGDRFLRHIERTAALLIIIDVSPGAQPHPETVPEILMRELEMYQTGLSERVKAIVAAKTDLGTDNVTRLRERAKKLNLDFFPISAVTRNGLTQLLNFMETRVGAGMQ
ncbi:GTPase ObgE [bacterium]|nr:GTPase ObgE [candidate division CSSED10-310 bacterium]